MIVGRGTTDPDANSDVSKLARFIEEGLGFGVSFVCYSGTARPSVAGGLQLAVKLGFKRVVIAPFFLFTGILVKRIYSVIRDVAEQRQDMEFLSCRYLGISEHVADALLDRAEECISGSAHMNCSLCKYRVQIVGYEQEVGAVQKGHHVHAAAQYNAKNIQAWHSYEGSEERPAYEPHPIEQESFRLIEQQFDWSAYKDEEKSVLQRLVHTTGDFTILEEIFISPGALSAGVKALSRRTPIVTDVTMVQSGLRRLLLERLKIPSFCFVHEEETRLMAFDGKLTRSAAGIRRAWEKFGNNLILSIGDAPTAVMEAVRLVEQHHWRPHLIIGLPVGFVGTRECKESLRRCVRVPRITNRGTRGGSPWAAAITNELLIRTAQG
ncbi:MAG: precorrin-8X methylmutase [Verrucomicrobia bacterium]|nr:precorrin-8X methylmutase [Verrucomicrobiota bacterium]